MQTFHTVLEKTKEQLLLALSILFVVLVLASSMMYYAEHDVQPEKFASIPDAMWWAIVTLATVGYGDIYPITPLGKLIGGVVVVAGHRDLCPACGHPLRGFHQRDPGKKGRNLPILRPPYWWRFRYRK